MSAKTLDFPMNARSLFEEPPVSLRLFIDDDEPLPDPQRHRIPNPVSPLADIGKQIAQQYADATVTDADRRSASTDMVVREFYNRWLRSPRTATLDPKTIQLDEEALAWLKTVGKPKKWPFDRAWAGPPIACITTAWLTSLATESIGKGISVNTVGKYLRHLRTMLNAAAKLGLTKKIEVTVPTEDVVARPFSMEEVAHIYRSLAAEPVMQVAFVVALGTGARFSDLFWMRWDQIQFDKRQVAFTAEKTDKFQVVALTEIPLLHLNRLPKHESPFASLIDQTIDPEWRGESQYVRWLNKRWRRLTGFAAPPKLKRDWPIGSVPHPWHSARATAAVWIETQMSGSGSKLLGHTVEPGERITRQHYIVPVVSADLRTAAEAVEWPEYFREISQICDRPRQRVLFD